MSYQCGEVGSDGRHFVQAGFEASKSTQGLPFQSTDRVRCGLILPKSSAICKNRARDSSIYEQAESSHRMLILMPVFTGEAFRM